VNTLYRQTTFVIPFFALLLACTSNPTTSTSPSLLVVAQGQPSAPPAPAGSAPLRGGVQQLPDQEARPRLLRVPSGQLLRIWNRWADSGAGAVLLASSQDGVNWERLIQLQPDGPKARAENGHVAVNEAGEIALAYGVTDALHIRLARSSDGGKTWTIPTDNLDPSGRAFAPAVAWGSGRTLLVTWQHATRTRYEIYTRRSPDGGVTWESATVMTPPPDPTDVVYEPRLVGDAKGRFWLAWVESRGGWSTLRLVRSEDNGRTWLPPQPIKQHGRSVALQSLELSSNNHLLILWHEQTSDVPHRPTGPARLYAASSKDGGATWSPPVRMDGLPSGAPTMASGWSGALTASGEAWVAWNDNRNGRRDIFLARSADGGLTWDSPQRVDADPAGTAESRNPQLAFSPDGKVVAVVWEDDRKGFEAIYGRLLVGGQWSAEARLGAPLPPKKAAHGPHIAATSNGAFYVVWEVWDHSHGATPWRSLDSAILTARP
jgi:BNR repeat-like domain